MSTNHQMNYYDYGKTLDIQGVMPVIGGGGVNPDPHEYVDLGLSVKWATCNIGANTPEEAGLYFAWGETSGYTSGQVGTVKNFSWENDTFENDYKFGPVDWDDETNYGMKRYNNDDNLSELTITNEPPINEIDDAAVVNWGNGWRMPTNSEFEELISSANTEAIFTQQNGVSGLLVTSKVDGYDGNSVFFPAAGSAENGAMSGVGSYGYCWSSSLGSSYVPDAWRLRFGIDDPYTDTKSRFVGYSVRPVRKSK